MAIEIKELRIKVNVVESHDDQANSFSKINSVKFEELKAQIVRECSQRVLEKIKERAER